MCPDELIKLDRILMELMKAGQYSEMDNRIKILMCKLEKEEVAFLLAMLRNPLLAPHTRKILLEYAYDGT